MSAGEIANARNLVKQAFSIGGTSRLRWISQLCVPESVKGGLYRVLVVALVLWIGVLFYHGWNEGSFMYNDAGTAINVDCKRGAESSLAQEMCKRAKLHRGVHPLVYAAEYALLGLQKACIDSFLAIMGSSILMISVFAFAAFCAALWYVNPSRRSEFHCHIPSIWDGNLSPNHLFPNQVHKGIDQILASQFSGGGGGNHNKFE